MAGPWEKFQTQAVPAVEGPWSKFQAAVPLPENVIPGNPDVPMPGYPQQEVSPMPEPAAPKYTQVGTRGELQELTPQMQENERVAEQIMRGPLAIPQMVHQGLQAGSEAIAPYMPESLRAPLPEVLTDALYQDPENMPQTPTGQAIGRIGSSVTGAMAFPGVSQAPRMFAASGLGAGLGAEAGAAFDDSPENRAAGSLIGAFAPGVGGIIFPTVEKLASRAVEGYSPEQLAFARENMRVSKEHGVDQTMAQALRGKGAAADIEDIATGMRAGSPLRQQLENQPSQVEALARSLPGKIPGKVLSGPQAANTAKKAATDAIQSLKDARTAATAPLLKASPPLARQEGEQMIGILQDAIKEYPTLDQSKALRTVLAKISKKQPILKNGKQVGTRLVPVTDDIETIHRAMREVEDSLKAPNLTGKQLGKLSAARVGEKLDQIKDMLSANRPDTYGAFREKYKEFTKRRIDPVTGSPTGQIARTGYDEAVQAAEAPTFSIFNAGTPTGARSEILSLQRNFARTEDGKAAFQDLATTWLSGKIDKALKLEAGMPVDAVAKNIDQAFFKDAVTTQGFKDVLAGAARSAGISAKMTVDGMTNYLKTIQMASKRPANMRAISSPEVGREMKTIPGRLASFSPIMPFRNMGRAYNDAINFGAFNQVSRLMQTPEGVAALEVLAKSKPGSFAATTAIARMNAALVTSEQEGQ